jgi:hypothetical protein
MLSIGVGDRGIPTSSIFKSLLMLVPMGMGAEVSISRFPDFSWETGEAEPVGVADRP